VIIGNRLPRDQRNATFVLVGGELESESQRMFPLQSTKCSISSLVSIEFNFKTPGFVLPIYIVPLISCSFHDSLPVRPLIDILPFIAYGSFVCRTSAMRMLCHLVLHSACLHWMRRSVRRPMEHLHQTLSDRGLQFRSVPSNLDLSVCVPRVAQTSSPVEWKPCS
jgi:hypothetical protein